MEKIFVPRKKHLGSKGVNKGGNKQKAWSTDKSLTVLINGKSHLD
jgi:hypothetical protein